MFCQKGQKKGYLLKKSLICDSANSMIKNRTRQGEVFVEIFRKSVETSSEDPKVSQFLQRSQHSNAPLNHSYKSYQLFFYKLWTFSILLFLILKQSKILQDSETPPPPHRTAYCATGYWWAKEWRVKSPAFCEKFEDKEQKYDFFRLRHEETDSRSSFAAQDTLQLTGRFLPWKKIENVKKILVYQ